MKQRLQEFFNFLCSCTNEYPSAYSYASVNVRLCCFHSFLPFRFICLLPFNVSFNTSNTIQSVFLDAYPNNVQRLAHLLYNFCQNPNLTTTQPQPNTNITTPTTGTLLLKIETHFLIVKIRFSQTLGYGSNGFCQAQLGSILVCGVRHFA